MGFSLISFKEDSLKKFQSMQPENSELFKYQTVFKDFKNEIQSEETSKETGIKIIEKPVNISIEPLKDVDLKTFAEKFDLDDKFVQMNNAFFNSGILIEVPNNQDIGALRISSSPVENLFSKIIIVMRDGSKANIVKESYSPDNQKLTISEDVLVIAHPESSLSFSEFQNYNQNSDCFSNKIAYCGKDGKVTWNLGFFGGARNRSRTYNFLEGDGSSVEDLQLTFGSGEQYFDAFSNLVHTGKSTTAKALAKGAFKEKSNSIFKGMIKIKEKAKNANSYLACHSMLLSKTSKANAIPSLEIETNDVKATHAASVSPIDEEKIFYLLSRGIDEESARKMITLGFFDPLIRSIESDEIRAKIRYLIEMKWERKKTESFEEKMLKEFMTEDSIKSSDIFEGHYKYR